jgi:hypothetical protein
VTAALTANAEPRPAEIPADGMVPLSALAEVFGTTRTARRWAGKLAGYLREKRAGEWYVSTDARLPGGQQVLSVVKCGAEPERYGGQPLPPGHQNWRDADWQHYDNLLELRPRYNELRARFPNVNKEELARLFAQEHGEWAHNRSPRSLSCKRKRLDIYFDRINPSSLNFDGGYDGRGRKSKRGELYSPEALAFFRNCDLDPRGPSVVASNAKTAKWARENGYTWNVSDRMAQKLVKSPYLSDSDRDFHRLGEKRWAHKHLPRIQRDLTAYRPGEYWQGDQSPTDRDIEWEDGSVSRAHYSVWIDVRSRFATATITKSPDTDSIWNLFCDLGDEIGYPDLAGLDNGKVYRGKSFSGGRLRKLDERYKRSLLGRCGTKVQFAHEFSPESKAVVERFIGRLHDELDREYPEYRGRNPETRPENLNRDLRKGHVKPTKIAVALRQLAEYLDVYNRTPHQGEGMENRSPRYVLEHCDPIPRKTGPKEIREQLRKRIVQVKLTKNGVRWRGIDYGRWNPKLRQRTKGEKLLLLVDPNPAAPADRVEVRDQEFRHVTWAVDDRIRGLTNEEIKRAKKAQAKARKLARAARPALQQAHKSTVEFALAARRERGEQLRKAAGAESDVPPPPRDLAIMPGALELVQAGMAPPPPSAPAEYPVHEMSELSLSTTDGRERESFDDGYGDDLHLDDDDAAVVVANESLADVSLSNPSGDEGFERGNGGGSQGSDPPAVADVIVGLDDG